MSRHEASGKWVRKGDLQMSQAGPLAARLGLAKAPSVRKDKDLTPALVPAR